MLKLVLALVALLVCSPAYADDFAGAVRALNADSFSDKLTAADTLAALGDGRAAAVFEAMADGRLYATADGTILIEQSGSYRDAVSGATVAASDAAAITVNNRLRGALRAAAGQLGLLNSDPVIRQQAAESMLATPNPDAADTVRKALAAETVPAIKALLSQAVARLDLADSDPAHRLSAIAQLAASSDPQVRGLLQPLADGDSDPQVKAAAQKAVSSIENRLGLIGIGVNIFQGISLGSVLLLAAIGLAVTFGVMGVINMAHGEMIMLGAYSTFVVQEAVRALLPPDYFGLYLVIAVPVAFVVTFAVGVLLERTVIRFLYGRPLETMLATWGISLMLQQLVRSLFGASNREVANPAWMTGGIELIGGFTLTYNRVVIILFCLAVLLALAAVLRWSRFGLFMRAVTQNRPMASAMGIPTGRIDAATFGLGSGIAGIAGVALSQIGNVSPNLGQGYIVDSFMVVVFGGVGSLWGTLVGALSLGLVNKLLEPYAGAMLGKILVLVAIILFIQKRPRGLFALKGRSVEG
ncbi:urea ABC transporter permease subunit UrtB [Insolitispirillum peregrinum]|uniref:Amino acid/amide ABC transporter membrane protein 1, HAAT family n=1 Tax=Insolitispirillum peregrinum TaxID=80876 RepID=A0A1N7L383_9PROT|nr:urea ABC transporter permease subunit UrtB [Insolitispirillum peregrinum]SIS68130.1 amino acid/amide ABC transporter membrane protein 1, HAAT family [Insolitispirillum peregrinum]